MRRYALAVLLFTVVLAAGCTPGGGDTQAPITVRELQILPQQIDEGTDFRAELIVANTGENEAELEFGDRGRQVLVDYCRNDFQIEEGSFDISTTGDVGSEAVTLPPGQEASLTWNIQHTGNVRGEVGDTCQFRFELPFRYEVSSFQEVELVESAETDFSNSFSRQTSSGPLIFGVEARGGIGNRPVYVAGDDPISMRLQLQNHGEEARGGLVNVHPETMHITATDPLEMDETLEVDGRDVDVDVEGDYDEPRCDFGSTADFRLVDGVSRVFSCRIPTPDIDLPARTADISAEMEYTYIKSAGTRTVHVRDIG